VHHHLGLLLHCHRPLPRRLQMFYKRVGQERNCSRGGLALFQIHKTAVIWSFDLSNLTACQPSQAFSFLVALEKYFSSFSNLAAYLRKFVVFVSLFSKRMGSLLSLVTQNVNSSRQHVGHPGIVCPKLLYDRLIQ